jgi:hypothetical protein
MKLGYHFALRWAHWRRRRYTRQLQRIAAQPFRFAPESEATLYSFSGTRDLPEMVACLRSFLRFALAPRRIVVVGDGTHTDSDRAILSALYPRLETIAWDRFIRPDLPPPLTAYAQAHPLGKKVAVLMSVPTAGPWIFSDSDILYFPAASDVRTRLATGSEAPEFLEDCYPSLDDRLIRGEDEKRSPVNSGFAVVQQPLDWTDATARFQEMPGEPGYFTEQTLFHLAMRRSGGRGLPKDRYVIQSDDQWMGQDRHVNPSVVLRHYFSSIRYKMWLKVPFA